MSRAGKRWRELKAAAKRVPHTCGSCGRRCSRKRLICRDCEKRWTGTHYARKAVQDGDAMEKRVSGSFESGKRR